MGWIGRELLTPAVVRASQDVNAIDSNYDEF